MFNLIETIPAEDKIKIQNYINTYGISNDKFIGLDNWLLDWQKNKIKLYKLLGDNLTYRKQIRIKKNCGILTQQMEILLDEHEDFYAAFKGICNAVDARYSSDYLDYWKLHDMVSLSTLLNKRIPHTIKVDKRKYTQKKKSLQIQEGTKPSKAINTILNYFEEDFPDAIKDILPLFEKFRIDYSMILNDDEIVGDLVISIHPLDFLTMSDNNSNWQSCMSWRADGCYHVGTVEMMNSNNVLCCYLESDKPFNFSPKKNKKETEAEGEKDYYWNNKRWRELVYVTKDIIVSGKPYPFSSDDISKELIETVRKLAAKNWGRTYQFGPELYQDMKHINGMYSMDRAKKYIRTNNTTKHNIIFDTRGMYNDMLNDSSTRYWCVRNKVNKTKVISYSGKAPCLCCGGDVLTEGSRETYNERYDNTDSVVCNSCKEKLMCDMCDGINYTDPLYTVKLAESGKELHLCQHCFETYIKYCPDCNELFSPFGRFYTAGSENNNSATSYSKEYFVYFKPINDLSERSIVRQIDREVGFHKFWHIEELKDDYEYLKNTKDGSDNKIIFPVCACKNCLEKKKAMFEKKKIESRYSYYNYYDYTINLGKEVAKTEDWEKYMYFNLKSKDPENGVVVKE